MTHEVRDYKRLEYEERLFFRGVLNHGIETGLISGREVERSESSSVDRGMWCCPCFIGVGRGDRTAVAFAVVVFVASFFVGLFYTVRSLGNIVEAQEEVQQAQFRIHQISLNHDPRSAAQNPLLEPYNAALELARGIRNERVVAAIGQGTMTMGAGLLTVVFLIVLIVEPEILEISLIGAGCGLVMTGATIYMLKNLCIRRFNVKMAAQIIGDKLKSSSSDI